MIKNTKDHLGETSQYKEIAKINQINNTEMIDVGITLKIPAGSKDTVETLDLDEISKETSETRETNREKEGTITQKPYQSTNPYVKKQGQEKTEFLKNYGFGEEDIKRIERGEIDVEQLMKEISQDKDPTRRKKLWKRDI